MSVLVSEVFKKQILNTRHKYLNSIYILQFKQVFKYFPTLETSGGLMRCSVARTTIVIRRECNAHLLSIKSTAAAHEHATTHAMPS